MPISKKDRVRDSHILPLPLATPLTFGTPSLNHIQTRREQKKADEAGTRTPKKANGNPVKPEKPKVKVRHC